MAWTTKRITKLISATHAGDPILGVVEATIEYDAVANDAQSDGAAGPTVSDITSHALRGSIVVEDEAPWLVFHNPTGILILTYAEGATLTKTLTIGVAGTSSGVVFTGCNVGPLQVHPGGGPSMRSTLTFVAYFGSATSLVHATTGVVVMA